MASVTTTLTALCSWGRIKMTLLDFSSLTLVLSDQSESVFLFFKILIFLVLRHSNKWSGTGKFSHLIFFFFFFSLVLKPHLKPKVIVWTWGFYSNLNTGCCHHVNLYLHWRPCLFITWEITSDALLVTDQLWFRKTNIVHFSWMCFN